MACLNPVVISIKHLLDIVRKLVSLIDFSFLKTITFEIWCLAFKALSIKGNLKLLSVVVQNMDLRLRYLNWNPTPAA